MAPNHWLNQCWLVIGHLATNFIILWSIVRKLSFKQENAFENLQYARQAFVGQILIILWFLLLKCIWHNISWAVKCKKQLLRHMKPGRYYCALEICMRWITHRHFKTHANLMRWASFWSGLLTSCRLETLGGDVQFCFTSWLFIDILKYQPISIHIISAIPNWLDQYDKAGTSNHNN